MKELFNEIFNKIIPIIFPLIILSIILIGLYQRGNEQKRNLIKVCEAYGDLVDTLRNETQEEEIKRIWSGINIKFPDFQTLEGRNEYKIMVSNNSISDGCNDVYGLTASFPSFEEIYYGHQKN